MAKYVFPKVELPKVDRSNFSLDKSVFISFSPSTIRVPYCKDVLPNDHWEIDLSAAIESMPMLSPMYGRWKARWAFFFEPYSNIYGFMDNNTRRSTESILKSNLFRYFLPLGYIRDTLGYEGDGNPVYSKCFVSDDSPQYPVLHWVNRAEVSGSSIWCDLGWPQGWCGYVTDYVESGIDAVIGDEVAPYPDQDDDLIGRLKSVVNERDDYGFPTSYSTEYLHAVKPLGYLDIIRNYYVNNQENRIPFIGYSEGVENFTNRVDFVDLDTLDYIFAYIRTMSPEVSNDETLSGYFAIADPLPSYENANELHSKAVDFLTAWEKSYFIPNGGAFLSSYAMDLNRGLMNAEQGNFQSYVSTDNQNRVSISQIYMANKIQEVINILDITGGRFSDWLNCLWNVDIKGDIDKPIYLGSHTEFISTTDIVSPSSTDGSTAGQQTGFSAGGFGREFKKISFNSDQYGVIYCVFNMIPEVFYSTGFKREDLKGKFTDIYNPRMARIGYQDVPAKVLTALPDTSSINPAFRAIQGVDTSIEAPDGVVISRFAISGFGDPTLYEVWLGNPEYTPFDSSVAYFRLRDTYLATTYDPNLVVGRQAAWAEYMSDVDETRGQFALNGSLSYWTLNRSYKSSFQREVPSRIVEGNLYSLLSYTSRSNYSTYVLPAEWNNLFADSSPDAENFRMFLKFNVFVKRAIPSRSAYPHI